MKGQIKMKNCLILALAVFLVWGGTPIDQSDKALRVGGDYQVSSIERTAENEFRVEFKALTPSGKFDYLSLHSNHIHVAVHVGQKLRLSAEILSSEGPTAEVAQVVVFVPNAQGPVPVWLLSSRTMPRDLTATKFIEMHNPLSDYVVM